MLQLENISLKLGNFQLQDISLHVGTGEYLVLLGPTGTGKTVLLETISGIHFADQGKIFLNGQDATHRPPETRRLGVVYQDYALFPHLTVWGNIAFGLRLNGESKGRIRHAVAQMAQFLDINHLLDRRPVHLSGGEQQRAALARALVLRPHMLLLDEPLSALDRFSKDRLRRELKRIHSELGVTVFHITHDLSEAFFLADRLVIMLDGTIIQEGSPEEILKRPLNRSVAELVGIENFIPAKLDEEGRVFLKGFGPVPPLLFPEKPSAKTKDILITMPGWSVRLFPQKEPQAYLWQGMMRIVNLNNNGAGYLEVELRHQAGGKIRATFSLPESQRFPNHLVPGAEVMIGLPKEGLHWVAGSDNQKALNKTSCL